MIEIRCQEIATNAADLCKKHPKENECVDSVVNALQDSLTRLKALMDGKKNELEVHAALIQVSTF